MEVTVDVAGDETRTVEVQAGATYGDLVAPLPVSIHEVSISVDGRTFPADEAITDDVDRVRVVRLVQGG